MKIVEIELLCWAVSMGGEHYTVDLRCGEHKVNDLEYVMTRKQARMFNDKDGTYGYGKFGRYTQGDKSTRFWTRKEARKEAVKASINYALKTWENVGLILVGDSMNPHEPTRTSLVLFTCSKTKDESPVATG